MRRDYHHHETSGHSEHRGHKGHSHHHEEFEEGEHRGHTHRHEEFEEGGHRGRSRRHASWNQGEEGRSRGEHRARVERGMLRYLLLDALQHGPKHGYEIIKWLEEQTYGRYAPSAGTVYPTLQLLQDQGLLATERVNEKSVYHLTEKGTAELQTRTDFTQEFWERNGRPTPPASAQLAVEFIYAELQELQRTVEKGVSTLASQNDQQNLLALRQILEQSKNEVRNLLIGNPTSAPQQARTRVEVINAQEIEKAIANVFVSEDDVLKQTVVRAQQAGLPPIQITALQGKLLQVLASACQARKILEIGALAGYSGIWLARALPADGKLITLEIDPKHAEVVRESFQQAQVEDKTEVRVGPALETLPQLAAEGPFDLIFIDADKDPYPQYLEWAIQLARPGSIIVADNCVRGGSGLQNVAEAETDIRGYNRIASSNPTLNSVSLPINTGMTVSVVLATTTSEQTQPGT